MDCHISFFISALVFTLARQLDLICSQRLSMEIVTFYPCPFVDIDLYRIVLAIDLELWYLFSLRFVSAVKLLGPKLFMIRNMVK